MAEDMVPAPRDAASPALPRAGAYGWESVQAHPVWQGVQLQIAAGAQLMMSMVTLDPGSGVPVHSHPHEQCGIWLEGEADFIIGETTFRVHPGDSYLIPAHTPHGVQPVDERARALDIFAPPREDYMRYRGR